MKIVTHSACVFHSHRNQISSLQVANQHEGTALGNWSPANHVHLANNHLYRNVIVMWSPSHRHDTRLYWPCMGARQGGGTGGTGRWRWGAVFPLSRSASREMARFVVCRAGTLVSPPEQILSKLEATCNADRLPGSGSSDNGLLVNRSDSLTGWLPETFPQCDDLPSLPEVGRNYTGSAWAILLRLLVLTRLCERLVFINRL